MTVNLLIDTFTLSLEHIGSILSLIEKDLTPKYSIGLKVKYFEFCETYSFVTYGKIVGVEYFFDPGAIGCGWSYHVRIDSTLWVGNDGTEKLSLANDYMLLHEKDVQVVV